MYYLKDFDYKKINIDRAILSETYNKDFFKTKNVINKIIKKATSNPTATFSDLYTLLSHEDLLYQALENIKGNEEIYTLGINKKPLTKQILIALRT